MTITSGSAHVAGVDVAQHPGLARTKIGVALQEAGLDPRQTGRELLVLQSRLFGDSPLLRPHTGAGAARARGAGSAADRLIKTYSAGMKRRLDVASALVHSPEVLFLDEPTTGLDPASRITLWEEIRRINALGTTIFLTTQYLEEADQLCDRIAITDAGVLVREGTPLELKDELASRTGADVTLDDVFLDATGRTRPKVEGDVQVVRS